MGGRIAVWTQCLIAGYLLAMLPVGLEAQEKSAEDDPPKIESKRDGASDDDASDGMGHDRPTPYPKIRFGNARNEEDGEKARKLKLKSRAYLVDISHAMMSTVTLDSGTETTRLDLMVGELKRTLDSLGKRRDHRFNMVTFGEVKDLAEEGELLTPGAKNIKRAKEWLDKLEAGDDPDLYAILKACFEQAPDGAALMVGSSPSAPAGVDEKEIEKYGGLNDFVVAMVKSWRAAGTKTSLDIIGIELPENARKFYKRLAKAGGGMYLDL